MSHQGTDPGGSRRVGPERRGLRSTARWAHPLHFLCAGVRGRRVPRGLGKVRAVISEACWELGQRYYITGFVQQTREDLQSRWFSSF